MANRKYQLRLFLLLIGMSFSPVLLLAQDKYVTAESRVFPGGHREDGMWTAISAASDGKVYFGLSTNGNSAHFYIYDPKRDEMRHRADLIKILGESGRAVRTNAKIHTPFVEAGDGKIYFASGSMGHGPNEIDPRSWEGGHWWCYDPEKDKLTDLGLVLPQQGVYALVCDKTRNRLYGTSAWGNFIIYDIETGITTDLGRVNNHRKVCRTMAIDNMGVVYGSYEPFHIFKYLPQRESIEETSLEIPTDRTLHPGKWNAYRPNWRCAIWDETRKKIYGIDRTSSILFEYDPYVNEADAVKSLTKLCADQHLDQNMIPYATLAFTLGKDDKIYYAPVVQPFDYTADLGVIGGDVTGSYHYTHLVTYDLNTGERIDHGAIKVENDAIVLGVGGATTGPDGTIYICAAVEEKNNMDAAGKVGGKVPFRMRMVIIKPDQPGG
ncbi:MAG: hypothetical protein KAV45_00360 [Calditrichia bacterium]|nr:hypothetical protein [Calditrichia bacterium]